MHEPNWIKAFLFLGKPVSVNTTNKKKKTRFKEALQLAYKAQAGEDQIPHERLYGRVYYFVGEPQELDADNLSKPVWDALNGIAYPDDASISLRYAGIVDTRHSAVDVFDLSLVPDDVAAEFIEVLGTEKHVLYVELGALDTEMFTLGRAAPAERTT